MAEPKAALREPLGQIEYFQKVIRGGLDALAPQEPTLRPDELITLSNRLLGLSRVCLETSAKANDLASKPGTVRPPTKVP
jgi:hypothetical protein